MERDKSVVAVGAGPANLAFAVAVEEMAPHLAEETLLVEQHDDIAWQRGMLLPWAQSQVGFLKDLVTLRNPRSRYSFVNYLHSTSRLDEFINLGTSLPYRLEVSAYLQWVAKSLELVQVEYGRSVTAITPVSSRDDGVSDRWRVQFDTGEVVRCRDVVIGVGRAPNIPAAFLDLPADRLIHSTGFTTRLEGLDPAAVRRVAVVGGAQSAAEMLWTMYQRFPDAECRMVMRSAGLRGYESSAFTNELYFPSFVDQFYAGSAEARSQVLQEMHRTNYAGLAPGMLDTLYRQMYQDRLTGRARIAMHTLTDVLAARMDGDEVVLTVHDRLRGTTDELRTDLVLLGTGFEQGMPALIRQTAASVGVTEIAVDRNYRLVTPDPVTAGCYLQGVNEATHGIADSLISVLAIRAGEMVTDMLGARGDSPPALVGTGPTDGRSIEGRDD
ncbi:SidA/IucD/PvdA family monooxygenase [Micromonospora sp. WMMD1076]|uniref:lysine N(6)-hydroxylase/L-ornithine N(5)-oxygenase family protein n=1 Tax=Micromonospora TaxID=1873 RepID=UPI00249B729F|nr:SidA/IucD/PvdA family monooxygenase [Micromonospora sp. WMMD1076]WFF09150.1 SidA/IucD/PvdA family monooxygenase [Micromonospora sp. WMMD1076]